MLSQEMGFCLTRDEINYAENFDEHWDLFQKGIKILEARIKKQDFSEFTDEERETLEKIYEVIEY